MKIKIIILIYFISIFFFTAAFSQGYGGTFRDADSIRITLPSDYKLYTVDTVLAYPNDTLIVLPPGTKYKMVPKEEKDETLRKVFQKKSEKGGWWGSLMVMAEKSMFRQDSTIRLSKGRLLKAGRISVYSPVKEFIPSILKR